MLNFKHICAKFSLIGKAEGLLLNCNLKKMKRLNITLPEEIKNVPNKSRFITQALKEKLERIKREKLDELLIEGYKATKKENKRIDKEWEKITLEQWK